MELTKNNDQQHPTDPNHYSDWDITEYTLKRVDYFNFFDNKRGEIFDTVLIDRKNLGDALELFQEKTGCPAMF